MAIGPFLLCSRREIKVGVVDSAFAGQPHKRQIRLHGEQLKRLPHRIVDIVVLAICSDQANDAIRHTQRRERNGRLDGVHYGRPQ